MNEMNNEVVSDVLKRSEPRTLEEFLAYEDSYCRPETLHMRGQRVLTPRQRARLFETHGPSGLG